MDLVTDDGCRLWTARTGPGPRWCSATAPGFWDTFDDLAGLLAAFRAAVAGFLLS